MRKTHLLFTAVSPSTAILKHNKEVDFKMLSFLNRCKLMLKFASSSLISFGLDYILFLAFAAVSRPMLWGLLLSNVAARLLSAACNYMLNKYLVFREQGHGGRDLLQYALLASGILAANSLLLTVFTALGLPASLAKLVTELTLFTASFTVQSLVIFRRKEASAHA